MRSQRLIRLAAWRDITVASKLGGDAAERIRTTVGVVVQPSRHIDKLGIAFSVALASLALSPLPPHAVASALQLGDGHGLVELRQRAEDLPDQFGSTPIV